MFCIAVVSMAVAVVVVVVLLNGQIGTRYVA